jgi:hypothetical protein
VDVALADHHHRTLPQGPKCNLQRKTKQFPADVSSKEACTAVVFSCQGIRLKVGKETGKGGGKREEGSTCLAGCVLEPHRNKLMMSLVDIMHTAQLLG